MGTATFLLMLSLGATWTSSGIQFVMTDKSLVAKQGDTVAFDLAKMTRDSVVQEEVPGDADDMTNWYASSTNTVLSIVGTLVTYSYTTDSYSGGAHPNASAGYMTIDVSTPKKPPSLYDWVPEADVVSALRKLGDALKSAETRTEGFLMKDAKAVHAASVSASWESKKKE